MKKVAAWSASVAGALVLSACSISMPYTPPPQQQPHMQHQHSHHMHQHQQQPIGQAPTMDKKAQRFSCQNGLAVHIRHVGGDGLELRLDDKYALLKQAVSGSGERYVANRGLFGRGAEWHQKGNEAFFSFVDPYGNAVNTSCRAGMTW